MPSGIVQSCAGTAELAKLAGTCCIGKQRRRGMDRGMKGKRTGWGEGEGGEGEGKAGGVREI
jgi:hypothetical protein